MSLLQLARRGRRVGRRDLLGAAVAVVVVNLIGASGVVATNPGSNWFQSLTLPWFYPPNWAFSVVWTVLFTLMGIAVFLVYRQGRHRRTVQIALGLFGLQMVVNVAWSPAFFTLQNPSLAFGIILLLWGLIGMTIYAFNRVDRRAAVLLIPYLCWVSFAALLNYGIWQLN